jgi:hypothetical protein
MTSKDDLRPTRDDAKPAPESSDIHVDSTERVPAPRTTGPANWPAPLRDAISSRLDAYRRRV